MAACIDSLLSEAIARFSELSLHTVNLKTEQKRAVKSLLSGRDVLAILPTGYRKSMIFQVFAVAKAISTKDPGTVLVVCPLQSLVKDQLMEAESFGLKGIALNSPDMLEWMDKLPDIVFASAEEVSVKPFRESLKRKRNIHAVLVDESHTVEMWTGER